MTALVETKFISLDNKEASYVRVEMPYSIVFYPYFHFRPAKDVSLKNIKNGSEAFKVYGAVHCFEGDVLEKVAALEGALFPDRGNEYGFWSARSSGGCFIGMGLSSLKKFFAESGESEAYYVVIQGEDLLFIFHIEKNSRGYLVAQLRVYFSDVEVPYLNKVKAVDVLLDCAKIKDSGVELDYRLSVFNYNKYTYLEGGASLQKVCETHVVLPEHERKPFRDHVESCAWHTVVFNDNIINEGPRFVLLRNPGVKLNNTLDRLSCWLVHRRGGFVMGEEFASNDFHQETTFTVREVNEFVFGEVSVLNVECDTYTRNRDNSFESFLKSLSPARFRR